LNREFPTAEVLRTNHVFYFEILRFNIRCQPKNLVTLSSSEAAHIDIPV
jgi:hypothetical protein